MMKRSILSPVVLGMALVAGAALAGQKDIVDTAVAAGSFKALVAAVKAAGLVDALKGEGPLPCSPPTMKRSPSCRRVRSRTCSSPKTRTSWCRS